MRPSHFALLLIILVLTWQTRGFAQVPAVPALTATDPAAAAILDASIKQLTRPEGVEVKFTQTVGDRKDAAVITGRSIIAANKRMLTELQFKQVGRRGQVRMMCDGVTFHRIESLPDAQQRVSYTLKQLQDALDKLATNEAERVAKEDVEKEQQGVHGFDGVAAMLKDLKQRMFFGPPLNTRIDVPGQGSVEVKVLDGRWRPEVVEAIAPAKKGDDPNQIDRRYLWNEKRDYFNVPRQAKLYFAAATGALVRVELLGIVKQGGEEMVLTHTDVHSVTALPKLEDAWFHPTAEELGYKQLEVDIATMVKNRHAQTMDMLKLQAK
jgi:hypothetical protein